MHILKNAEITGVVLGVKCYNMIFYDELTGVGRAKKMIVHFGFDLCWGFGKLERSGGF